MQRVTPGADTRIPALLVLSCLPLVILTGHKCNRNRTLPSLSDMISDIKLQLGLLLDSAPGVGATC